jgi:hypothetical protein
MHILGLDPNRFDSWFDLDDAELAARGARRVVADSNPGYPDRVSLADASVGDELLLVPFAHHVTDTPYRASGPVFVRRGARQYDAGRIPDVLRGRTLSVRAYSAAGDLVMADVCDGVALDEIVARQLGEPAVGYIHVHFAKPGCFACRIDRQSSRNVPG